MDVIRRTVVELARSNQDATLELGMRLGAILAEGTYKNWGFPSFREYVDEDLANKNDPKRRYFSRSYCYRLAKMGVHMAPIKEKVAQALDNKTLTVRRLLDLTDTIDKSIEDRQEVKDAVFNHIEFGHPIPTSVEKKQEKSELAQFTVYVPREFYDDFRRGLTKAAIELRLSSPEEAVIALAIDAADKEVYVVETGKVVGTDIGEYEKESKQTTFIRFRDQIENNSFVCRACKKIPLQPTWHHVVPRSVAGGYGPQVILCADCHYNNVQPHWREWAKRWKFDVAKIIAESKEKGAEPTIEDTPDEHGDD